MDTVEEETAWEVVPEPKKSSSRPPSRWMTQESLDGEAQKHTSSNSRRPSLILAALRRPSQSLALRAAHVIMNQRRLVADMMNGNSTTPEEGSPRGDRDRHKHRFKLNSENDDITIVLSTLYAKLMVVLGIAFPVTEIISTKVPAGFYQGFYFYLYFGSVLFVIFLYFVLQREKALFSIINTLHDKDGHSPGTLHRKDFLPVIRYGSYYLRLGAIAFGIGSMVYSGLEFGQYFELMNLPRCNNIMIALTPAARMLLTIVQMQFIFLKSKDLEQNRYRRTTRFGIMHMIATNMCEWLHVIVEETKHEIVHLEHGSLSPALAIAEYLKENSSLSNSTNHKTSNGTGHHDIYECQRTKIMGSLVQNASPFLFPCTIEYSLICAVILFHMWKSINIKKGSQRKVKPGSFRNNYKSRDGSMTNEKLAQAFTHLFAMPRVRRSSHHFSLDCAGAHKGLFSGIMVVVMTIISLIMFFVLKKESTLNYIAILQVNICELILYLVTLLAVLTATVQMRDLKYVTKKGGTSTTLGLDIALLGMAQAGVLIYCLFSIIGCYFTMNDPGSSGVIGLVAELLSLIQTLVQTIFILDAWWRRCSTVKQAHRKPGRQAVTFLLVANMALWSINTLEKNRADFRPSHLQFFGVWAWTIITHVSMPLAIFYRFHSTICLFEVWKKGYKMKTDHN